MAGTWPWAAGAATGVGSLPGTDAVDAAKLVFGELPHLPHLPELPARGAGADMIGRGAGLLVDLAVELYAGRWRVASRPGLDRRRTLDLLERDLDAMAEAGSGYSGPLKVQVPGPWTLAAGLELQGGGLVLRDHGACRDLASSLAEGVRAHLAGVSRRLPDATVLLQLDEPSLPAVLAGRVRTESGLFTYRSVERQRAEEAVRSIVDAAGVPVVLHCCAPHPPLALFRAAGATAVSLDLTLFDDSAADARLASSAEVPDARLASSAAVSDARLASSAAVPDARLASSAEVDTLGEAIDAGLGVLAGVVPSLQPTGTSPTSAAAAQAIVRVWRRLGFPVEQMAAQVVVTPTCGLAGASPQYARTALALCAEAGRRLAEEGWGAS
jgi:methionine synthase II (cobalamin-independent)